MTPPWGESLDRQCARRLRPFLGTPHLPDPEVTSSRGLTVRPHHPPAASVDIGAADHGRRPPGWRAIASIAHAPQSPAPTEGDEGDQAAERPHAFAALAAYSGPCCVM